jgi:hypothetical protein
MDIWPAARQSALADIRLDRRGGTVGVDDPAMTRRADPARIEAARRAATIARLVSGGRSSASAAALVAEWESAQARTGRPPGRSDWEGFDRWLADRRSPS